MAVFLLDEWVGGGEEERKRKRKERGWFSCVCGWKFMCGEGRGRRGEEGGSRAAWRRKGRGELVWWKWWWCGEEGKGVEGEARRREKRGEERGVSCVCGGVVERFPGGEREREEDVCGREGGERKACCGSDGGGGEQGRRRGGRRGGEESGERERGGGEEGEERRSLRGAGQTWFGQSWLRFWPKLVLAKLGLAKVGVGQT